MATIQSTLTCQFTHLYVRGYCKILSWDNNIGIIQMMPFKITHNELQAGNMPLDLIKARVNDNGFGSQEIISFHAMIDAYYEHDAKQYIVEEIYYDLKSNRQMLPDELEQFDKLECEL